MNLGSQVRVSRNKVTPPPRNLEPIAVVQFQQRDPLKELSSKVHFPPSILQRSLPRSYGGHQTEPQEEKVE